MVDISTFWDLLSHAYVSVLLGPCNITCSTFALSGCLFFDCCLCVISKGCSSYSHGGVLASTWVLKHKEHTGADEDLDKNVHFVIGNDYALAA